MDGFVYNKEKTKLLFCPCAESKEVLTIPEGVKDVVAYASFGCDVIQKVVIPSSVTNFDKQAIVGAAKMRVREEMPVYFPIGVGAKSFTEYVVDERNKFYSSVGGLLLDKKGETLIACASGCKGHVQVPDTVKKIDEFAFHHCEWITDVIIPDGVTRIDNCAFCLCLCLKKVSLPKALKGKINEKDVFCGCAADLKIVYRD